MLTNKRFVVLFVARGVLVLGAWLVVRDAAWPFVVGAFAGLWVLFTAIDWLFPADESMRLVSLRARLLSTLGGALGFIGLALVVIDPLWLVAWIVVFVGIGVTWTANTIDQRDRGRKFESG